MCSGTDDVDVRLLVNGRSYAAGCINENTCWTSKPNKHSYRSCEYSLRDDLFPALFPCLLQIFRAEN